MLISGSKNLFEMKISPNFYQNFVLRVMYYNNFIEWQYSSSTILLGQIGLFQIKFVPKRIAGAHLQKQNENTLNSVNLGLQPKRNKTD